MSIYFDDISKNSLEQDWQHKHTKNKQSTLAQEGYTNAAAWQIDNLEILLVKIEKDPEGVLSIILDMQSIYTKYLEQANKGDIEHDEIHICALGLEQELHISNEEIEQVVFLLQ